MKPVRFPRLARSFPRVVAFSGLLLLAAFACGAASPPAGSPAPRKNVLFLIADDLNNRLGSYGDPLAKTPNLDRLAARGVRFDRAYCAYPLCGPSRNSLLTGLYPNSTGVLENSQIFRQSIPAQPSLPQMFRLQGYFAARIGKLYHYNVPNAIGTDGHDDPASWELELNPAGVDRLEEQPKIATLRPREFGATLSWYASPKPDDEHTDGKLALDAEWVLERCAQRRNRPFFLAVGFFRPHTPFVAPRRPYFEQHPEVDMPIAPNARENHANVPAAALMSAKREQDGMTDAQRRQARQGYYASISFMDAQVGRVIATLDRLGLSENTIIVFTSDHGYHLGEHGLWQKRSLFEESARVPLLLVAPGIAKPGIVVAAPASLVDVFPTLAELCGLPPPDNLQGQSLVPMLADSTATGRGWALTQVRRDRAAAGGGRFFGYSLRTTRWRYTEWAEGEQGSELYDHETDPQESTNLVDMPGYAETVRELSRQLRGAVKTTFPPAAKIPALRTGELWSPVLMPPLQ